MAESSPLRTLLRRLLWRARGGAAVHDAHLALLESPAWRARPRAMSYTALDCEMTGLDPRRDEILSIGAVRIRDGRVVLKERFYRVFKPDAAVSRKEIVLLHGLGDAEVKRGTPLPDSLDDLLAFLGDSVVVAHFAEIDVGFLNAALARDRRAPLANPALDTRLLHRWHERRQGRPEAAPGERPGGEQLEALARELGLPRFPAHHAFFDAVSAGLLFLKLLEEFERAGQVQFRALFKEAGIY